MKYLLLVLILAACSFEPVTRTATPTPTMNLETAVVILTGTPTPTASPTASPSPTVTGTPAPTWTPWLIDMDFSPSESLSLDPANPAQNCMLTYFDLSPAPGHLRVWRRDNGGYFVCMKELEQPA